jgi:hypothetical protein
MRTYSHSHLLFNEYLYQFVMITDVHSHHRGERPRSPFKKGHFLKAHEWLLLSGDACAFILRELKISDKFRTPLTKLGYLIATVACKSPQPEHFPELRKLTIR